MQIPVFNREFPHGTISVSPAGAHFLHLRGVPSWAVIFATSWFLNKTKSCRNFPRHKRVPSEDARMEKSILCSKQLRTAHYENMATSKIGNWTKHRGQVLGQDWRGLRSPYLSTVLCLEPHPCSTPRRQHQGVCSAAF